MKEGEREGKETIVKYVHNIHSNDCRIMQIKTVVPLT